MFAFVVPVKQPPMFSRAKTLYVVSAFKDGTRTAKVRGLGDGFRPGAGLAAPLGSGDGTAVGVV